MTDQTQRPQAFDLSAEAAEFYESAFVPAFFAQWAPVLCDAGGVRSGHDVLDVACGTGIVARTAAEIVEPGGKVTGIDLNPAMLAVARRVRPDVEWREGDANALPLDDSSFDVVLSQMALMFLEEPRRALEEMARVVKPGGTVAILLPGALEHQEAFADFVDLAVRHAGEEAAALLSTYFRCGDLDALAATLAEAGLVVTSSRTEIGTYRAPSVDGFVTTEVESTPLVDRMSADTYRRIREEAPAVLGRFAADDGSVQAPFEVNIVAGRRP